MKVMVDLRKLGYKPSGIGMYTYNILKKMLNDESLEVMGITDVAQSNEIRNLQAEGMEIISYGEKVDNNFKVFKYFKFIEKVLGKSKADIFWEPNFIINKNLKKKFPNLKIIINIHDIIPIVNPEFSNWKYRLYFKFFLKRTIKFSDGILFISNDAMNKCRKEIKSVNSVVSLLNYPIISCDRWLEKKEDKEYFLFVGNIEKRKGIEILISAYQKYVHNGGNKKLIICGTIKEERLKVLIFSYAKQLEGKIEFKGYINDDEKIKLISKCSAFIFPSYAEGFGIPPIEAIYAGKPVITSDLDVFKEVMGKNSNYFNIKNRTFEEQVESLESVMWNYKKLETKSIEVLKEKLEYKSDYKNITKFFLDIDYR